MSNGDLVQQAKRLMQVNPDDLSQQLISDLQAVQRDLEVHSAALLTAQLRRYRDLFELLPIGLLVLDAEACILESNLTFAQMLGTDRSNLIGCYLSDFVTQDGQDIYHYFFHFMHTIGQPQQCEVNLINHGPLVVKLNGLPVRQDGEKTIYHITVINVTKEKLTESDKLEQVAERQRVKILADFITATSHDLRTPLTQITTGLYLVGKAADKELQLKKIDEINQQVLSLAQILEQLQAMAVLDSLVELQFQPATINRVLTDVITAVKTSADAKAINLTSNLQNDLPKISLDADKMFLALLNLINNAIQFTLPGGHISLTTHQQGHQIAIDVIDDGIGIPDNIIPHIFDRFF